MKSGFIKVSIRRTNGMVAYTPSLDEKNPLIGKEIYFYLPKSWIQHKDSFKETTFIFSLTRGFQFGFG
jgi:hypothetical protein